MKPSQSLKIDETVSTQATSTNTADKNDRSSLKRGCTKKAQESLSPNSKRESKRPRTDKTKA